MGVRERRGRAEQYAIDTDDSLSFVSDRKGAILTYSKAKANS